MASKRPNLKIHKPTVWILLVVVIIFVVLAFIALENSADRHDRKLMPSKNGMESRKETH